MIEIPTRAYLHSLTENDRNRRDKFTVFNDQDREIDNNRLTNLDSITVNRNPTIDKDNEVSNKKYFDDDLDKKNYSQI